MNYYALIYRVVDHYIERRTPFRELHLHEAKAATERGELLLAGAFASPVDGALLVFRADSRAVVENFARNDPYVPNGLVTKWEVRDWTVVVGSMAGR
jgi:uncharacterized protein YciI